MLNNPVALGEIVRKVALDQSQWYVDLPPPVKIALDIFSNLHIAHRMIKQALFFRAKQEEGTDPVLLILTNLGVQCVADANPLSKKVLELAILTKCAEEALSHTRNVYDAVEQTISAFYKRYPACERIATNSEIANEVSPSFIVWMRNQCIKQLHQAVRVSESAFVVIGHTFKLSMCLYDIALIFSGDRNARFWACTELLSNLNRYYASLIGNEQLQIEEVFKRQGIAQKVVKGINPDEQELLPPEVVAFIELTKKLALDITDTYREIKESAHSYAYGYDLPGIGFAFHFNRPRYHVPILSRYAPWPEGL